MEPRRVDWLVLAAGIVALTSPLYWSVVDGTRLVLIDPFAALGFTPGGGFLVVVGVAYVSVAATGIWTQHSERDPFETLAAGGLAALALAWFVTWQAFHPNRSLVEVASSLQSSLVVATAPIALAAAAGAAEDPRRRLLVVAAAAVAVGQFLVMLVFGLGPFRFGSLAGLATFLLGLVIPVFDVAFGYPLFRYGWQLVRGEQV